MYAAPCLRISISEKLHSFLCFIPQLSANDSFVMICYVHINLYIVKLARYYIF